MNYTEALDFIHSTYKFGSKLGLDNIAYLMNILGNPQKNLKFVHVAGTNGKGSTCTMLSYVLKEAGYKTGLFTSPYLEDFKERIQIDNELISEEDMINSVVCVKSAIDKMIKEGKNHPTEFEVVTAIAFHYYNLKKVDIVVLEVGMGGRLDATNIIQNPEVVVITSISLDHKEYLGNTVEEIAFEKASIIKYGCPVVVYPQKESVLAVIREFAQNKLSRVHLVNSSDMEILDFNPNGQTLLYQNKTSNTGISKFNLGLIGFHQTLNALTVLKTLELLISKGYNISSQNILDGLGKVKFMGRLEVLNTSPFIIIDGAHNLDGIEQLSKNIQLYFSKYNVYLYFGMLSDKDIASSIKSLLPYCERIVTLTPNNPRARAARDTAKMISDMSDIEVVSCDDINESIKYIKHGKDDVNIYCGSLYMIGDARKAVLKLLK